MTQDQLRVGVSVAWGRYLDHAEQTKEIHRLEERLGESAHHRAGEVDRGETP